MTTGKRLVMIGDNLLTLRRERMSERPRETNPRCTLSLSRARMASWQQQPEPLSASGAQRVVASWGEEVLRPPPPYPSKTNFVELLRST